MKPGRAGTMTHDYKRHGTTTLFAALNILDGTVVGHNMQRHRRQEFNRFLNTDAKNSSLDLAGLFDQEFRDVTDLFHRSLVDVEANHLVEPPLTLVGMIKTG